MNATDLTILRCYDEPHRRYHTVFHVLEMLEMHASGATRGLKIEGYRRPDFGVMEADFISAVVAHDCVYRIGREKGHNEHQSLKVWQSLTGRHERLRSGVVEPLILATIEHTPESVRVAPGIAYLVRHMIDLDMAPLAADPDEYDRNSANLKQEFLLGGVEPAAFDVGRRAFLERTLEQPSIFFTNQFRDALEPKARANMRRALEPGYRV